MSQPNSMSLSRLAAPLALVLVTQVPAVANAAILEGLGPVPLVEPSPPLFGMATMGSLEQRNRIDGLSVEELEDGTTVLRVQGSRKPTFNVYRLSGPERLVVDIAGSEPGKVVPHVPLDTWACGRVTVDGVQERDTNLVRLVIELRREASYIVLPKGEELVITVTPREMAPEAYFARKSAHERRTEIERSARDVKALEAEARALASHARQQQQEIERKVSQARGDAEAAQQAEQRAAAAERRATTAEAEARRSLEEASGGKLRLRRALKQAEQARAEAQAEREQAQAERKRADRALARARAEVEAEREQLAKARGQAEVERKQLAEARGRAEQAEVAAAAKLQQARAKTARAEQDAAKLLSAARAELTEAEADAKVARAKADAELARAQKDAKRAAAAARAADAAAKHKLEQAAAEAEARLEQARADATKSEEAAKQVRTKAEAALAKAEQDAAKKLAAAEAAETRAKEILAEARARGDREAAQKLAAATELEAQVKRKAEAQARAEQEAAKKVAAAEKLEAEARRKADAIVAEAKVHAAQKVAAATAAAKLEAERKLAAAEAEAERELAQAKAQAEKSAVREAERALAQVRARSEAEIASKVAKAQAKAQREVDEDLAKARKQAEGLEAAARAKLAQAEQKLAAAEADAARKHQSAAALEEQAKVALAKAERELAAAKSDAASKHQSVAALEEQAKAALAKAERELAAAQAERRAAASARTKADKALARVEREIGEAETRGRVSDELQRSLAAAKQAKAQADARLTSAKAEIDELEDDRDALERTLAKQQAKSEALADEIVERSEELASLERKVADARQQLAKTAAPGNAAAPEGRSRSRSRSKAPSDDEALRSFVRDVRFEDDDDESRVIVEIDGPVRFEGRTLTPDIQLLALEGVHIDPSLERSLDARDYAGPVERITSFAEDGGAKVIVATRGPVGPRLEQGDGKLVWHFPRDANAMAAARPRKGPPAHEVASLPGPKVGGFASSPPLAAMMAPAPSGSRSLGPSEPTTSQTPTRNSARWRGERIDIELQDAPIKDVLLLFSDIGRVNIIAGRNVEGSVTMKLTAVPWDQALDIILRSLELGMVREGNVIRVATAEDLENERRQAIEQANARIQLKPLETKLVPISYATVDEMIPKVQSVLSPRGTVTPDSRTNQLIIMDVAENIALAEQLVANLDAQTPQVLIEARIVEARTNFQRTLGIQWGFDFTASPGTGNPTGLLFPNSVGLAGGATGTPADARGLVLPSAAANPNYVVDLPAPVGTGSGGALGFSFGSISGNLNTNLRLSQLEETGEVRIISAPKIVTLDNSEAQIEQGVQIPISQVSAQGVNTRFVNATLALRVTPHVTNEGAVLLDVEVQKNEADFINTGARGDPTILTKQASSRMLVNDSDTAVIGGIYTRNRAVNYSKVPWLADIPIVGWFFKNKNEADTRSEVLIFLTPKIVNRASSIGG